MLRAVPHTCTVCTVRNTHTPTRTSLTTSITAPAAQSVPVSSWSSCCASPSSSCSTPTALSNMTLLLLPLLLLRRPSAHHRKSSMLSGPALAPGTCLLLLLLLALPVCWLLVCGAAARQVRVCGRCRVRR
jgi:hypothetical protein